MDAVKLLGSLMNNKSLSSGLGSQLLSDLLGGNQQQQTSGSGLAGLLSGVLGGSGKQSGSSPLGGLLDLLGSGQGAGGDIGGILGSVLGRSDQPQAQQATAPAPTQHQHSHDDANDQAITLIRAMINAAKSDGRIDQKEQENIISKLGADVSESEVEFLKEEFAAPLDVPRFARSVPEGMEQQVYAISLTSIELDTQNEAQYLGNLAQGLKLDPKLCNQIHEHLGAPQIFG